MKFHQLMTQTAAQAATPQAQGRADPSARANAKDVVDTAANAGQFQTLLKAVRAAGLSEILKGPGPFTIFAPTDEAFAKLPGGTLDSLLKPENKAKLAGILNYHVIPGRVMAADVRGKRTDVRTLQGSTISVDATRDVMINNARVVTSDVFASNGVIHAIDAVVMPKMQ
jgi:uncharacterized surface protein with fasciclin (FAS1) repeats